VFFGGIKLKKKKMEEYSEGKLYFKIVKILEKNLDEQEFNMINNYIQELQVENQKMKDFLYNLNSVFKRYSIE
jgi:hypothetical protein